MHQMVPTNFLPILVKMLSQQSIFKRRLNRILKLGIFPPTTKPHPLFLFNSGLQLLHFSFIGFFFFMCFLLFLILSISPSCIFYHCHLALFHYVLPIVVSIVRYAIHIVRYISVDTQFCTHDLIKENNMNDHPCTPKIRIALHASICSCITCINLSLHYMH